MVPSALPSRFPPRSLASRWRAIFLICAPACLPLAHLPARAQDGAALAPIAVFDSAAAAIRRQFFDPRFGGANLDTIVYFRRQAFLPPRSSQDVAGQVNGLLSELHYSGVFYRGASAPDMTPAFRWRTTRDGPAVTSIEPNSDCQKAGLRVGDILLTRPRDLPGARGSMVTLRV